MGIKQWTDLAVAVDCHVFSTNYFLILVCQRMSNVFKVLNLLDQVLEVGVFSFKTRTLTSDERARLQDLRGNMYQKVLLWYK